MARQLEVAGLHRNFSMLVDDNTERAISARHATILNPNSQSSTFVTFQSSCLHTISQTHYADRVMKVILQEDKRKSTGWPGWRHGRDGSQKQRDFWGWWPVQKVWKEAVCVVLHLPSVSKSPDPIHIEQHGSCWARVRLPVEASHMPYYWLLPPRQPWFDSCNDMSISLFVTARMADNSLHIMHAEMTTITGIHEVSLCPFIRMQEWQILYISPLLAARHRQQLWNSKEYETRAKECLLDFNVTLTRWRRSS